MVATGPEDDLDPIPGWSRRLRRVWPFVRATLNVLQVWAVAGHHEGLAYTAQTLVVLGTAAVESWSESNR